MKASRHHKQAKRVTRLVLTALVLSTSAVAAHAGPNDDYYIKSLPPGCEPKPGVDLQRWAMWMGYSHNQITCREKVDEAVWPHPEVPKPRWPVLKRVPHSFDLAAANDEEGRSIGTAYYRHLCETESGVWFYREVKDPKPLSVINLRPRDNEAISVAKKYDRYWLAAPALMDLSMVHELLYDFKGEAPYRGLSAPPFGGPTIAEFRAELYERATDPETKVTKNWLRTDPPRQLPPGWHAFEESPGAISVVERPPRSPYLPGNDPVLVRHVPTKSDLIARQNKLVRFTYSPVGEVKNVKLASGRDVLAIKVEPAKECVGDEWRKNRYLSDEQCVLQNGFQHLVVTPSNTSTARYGYAWREFFMSEHDLRLGIVGADLMVADMRTGELVALYRSFSLTVPTKPYIPFRTSTWIENDVFSCHEPTQQMSNIKGSGFVRKAIGAGNLWTDPRRLHEPPPISPLPELGDELVTRPWVLPDELPRQRLEPLQIPPPNPLRAPRH